MNNSEYADWLECQIMGYGRTQDQYEDESEFLRFSPRRNEPSYWDIATSFSLWQDYFPQLDFHALNVEERLESIINCFGPEPLL